MKIQYMSIRHFFALLVIATSIWSCTDNTTATFITPSTYGFTAPFLEEKSYYLREDSTFRKITDTLEEFLADNDIVADSINNRLNKVRSSSAILRMSFKNGTEVDVTIGRLDTIIINNKKVLGYTDTTTLMTTYQLSANKVLIKGFESEDLELNNEFREIHQCFHVADRAFNKYQSDTIADRIRNYDFRNCSFNDNQAYINFMQNSLADYKMDTLAIYRVSVIYSNYK
jgi:hypothetical protein